MSAPPMGMIKQHAERQRNQNNARKHQPVGRIDHQPNPEHDGHAQQREVDGVLAFVGDRPGGDDLHELAGRHQTAREGQEAQNHLGHQGANAKRVRGS